MSSFDSAGVGYIGLGTMGEPMARNVVKSGASTLVFDLNDAAMDRLVDAGAMRAESIRQIARQCGIILINVVNDRQVEEIVLDEATGLIDELADGSVIVVHSTVAPATCQRLAAHLSQRGVGLIDAPFTGGAAAAAAGTLSLLVGGEAWCVEAARGALESQGTITHLGSVGMGELAKLGNNLVMGITMRAIAEALRLGAAGGLDEAAMLDVLTSGAANSWLAAHWDGVGQMAASYPGGAQGLGNLTRKDLSLALRAAEAHALPLPVTALAAEDLEGPYRDALALWERRQRD